MFNYRRVYNNGKYIEKLNIQTGLNREIVCTGSLITAALPDI